MIEKGRMVSVGCGGRIGSSSAIVGMSEAKSNNLLGRRGREIRVKRAAATETASRTECITDFFSRFLIFDSEDGADLLTNEHRHLALWTTEED